MYNLIVLLCVEGDGQGPVSQRLPGSGRVHHQGHDGRESAAEVHQTVCRGSFSTLWNE